MVEGDLIDFSDNSGNENAGDEIAVVQEEEDEFEKFIKAAAAFQDRVACRPKSELPDDTSIPSSVAPKEYPLSPRSEPHDESSETAPANADNAPAFRSRIFCTECNVVFSSHAALLMHQTSTEHNYCRLCDGFFSNLKNFKDHYDRIHSLSCIRCARIFVSQTTLTDHQRESKHGYCVECDCYFLKKASHDSHMGTMHGIDITSRTSSPQTNSILDDSKESVGCGYCTQCDAKLEKGETMADHAAENHPY